MRILYLLIFLLVSCNTTTVVKNFEKTKEGVLITTAKGVIGVFPLSDNAMRIKYVKDTLSSLPELIFSSKKEVPEFKVIETSSTIEVKGKAISTIIDGLTGSLSYANKAGDVFLSEKEGTRKLEADTINGEPCYLAEQSFKSPSNEYIFGLGQFQDGHYNLKNITRRLTQVNSQIAVPFIYSSKGYGLLWHQYGVTDFNPNDNFVSLNKEKQEEDSAQIVEVTTTSGTQKVARNQSLYTGVFSVEKDGEYSIFLDLGDMGNRHFVAIDGEPYIDQSNVWLPPTVSAVVELTKGEHKVQIICKSDNAPNLSWRLIDKVTTFRSPNAKMLDYVVFNGSSTDEVIAAYRNLSGHVPMLPKWAFGFWQCRERYTSGDHLVETVKEFRKRKLPLDVIVQDWQYWGSNGWGVPKFDENNYPNPSGFIKEIHDLNAHFNISIWSNPDKNSEIGKRYVENNRFIPNTKWLDYFNPSTRKEYWATLKDNLFDHGVDSWWMDATEPENDALKGTNTYMGSGDFYRLTYPLMVSQAVYEGQRETTLDKRVCILTRSAFLGQQRYGIINWSGDIGGTWDAYKRQIVAGLNFTITGFPYWTTDIGGFFRPGNSQYTDKDFHELLTRWYQWGAFNPIFRMHGYQTETEPWKYGQEVEDNMREISNIRYRLLPYIYSEAWQVTKNGSTIMRPMIMDFADDEIAINQAYQYMFGKSLLVAPVTEKDVDTWSVYLPKNSNWYNFWNGEYHKGGQTINADAPLNKIPLFVKEGAIVPMGDIIQFTGQQSTNTLDIRIYPGADGYFELYEDEGDNYNYEKGKFTIIPFRWNDRTKTLTIENVKGDFYGNPKKRIFNFEIIDNIDGFGISQDVIKTQVVYSGKRLQLSF